MVAPSVLPGRAFQRVDRVSRLLFHWTARDLSLVSRSGQLPTFSRASPGAAIDSKGRLRTVVHSQPRFELVDLDGDGVRETPGILLEGSRTNAWDRSEEADHANWTRENLASVTVNALTAPNGTLTAEKLVEDTTIGVGRALKRDTPALTDNTKQATFAFVKDAGRWLRLRTTDKANTSRDTWFNPATGAFGTINAGHTVGKVVLAGGWYLVWCVWDSSAGATTPAVRFGMATGDGNITYTGDGVSGMYIWGMQFEADVTFPSSYIATVASTVSRSPDSLIYSFNFKPRDLTILSRVFRPVHTDVPGTLGVSPRSYSIGTEGPGGGGVVNIRLAMQSVGRNWESFIDHSGTDRSVVTAIPAGNELLVCSQFKALATAAQVQHDVGLGFGGFSSVAGALPAFSAQTLRLGGANGSTGELFGLLLELKVAAGLYTLAQMREFT